jgi:hypothetical protein
MSKEAALRAMREAAYAARQAGTTATPRTAAPKAASPAATPAKTPAKKQAANKVAPPPSDGALCGHRSMNGRSCTREQGHTAKSHRYS